MALSESLVIELVAKVDKATKQIDSIEKSTSGLSSTVGKLGKVVGGAFAVGAVVDFSRQAINSFSSLEQSIGGVESVFGSASATMLAFGQNAAETVGLANSQYNTLATGLGGLLKSSGFSEDIDEVAGKTDELIKIGADLAATYGGSTEQAVEALGSAFRGEADAAERFNLRLNASTVAAKAVELGLAKTTSEVDNAARATAIMTLVQEQSADALGQFGREADTVAGKQARLTAKWEDAQAEIGNKLLPVVLALFTAFEPLIPTIVDLVTELAPLITALVPLVELIGDLAISLIPVLTAVVGPLAELLGAVLTPVVEFLAGAFDKVAAAIRSVVDWIKKVKIPSWLKNAGNFLGDVLAGRPPGTSLSSSSVVPTSTLSGFSSPALTGGYGGSRSGATVNVYTGVGDPVRIGAEVDAVLSAYYRTNGRFG